MMPMAPATSAFATLALNVISPRCMRRTLPWAPMGISCGRPRPAEKLGSEGREGGEGGGVAGVFVRAGEVTEGVEPASLSEHATWTSAVRAKTARAAVRRRGCRSVIPVLAVAPTVPPRAGARGGGAAQFQGAVPPVFLRGV